MRLQICVFAVLALVWAAAEAQDSATANQATPSTSQPLLRIERLRDGEDVCALVRGDGTYRLENLVRAKGDMYAGTANADQLGRLRSILADAQLRSISQDEIKTDLLTDTLDHLDLAIWRDRGWQVLAFRTPSSRKAFKDSLDPLLTWFQELQKKRPGATEVPGPATRCLPPNQLQARSENQTPTKSVSEATTSGASPSYLFRLLYSGFHDQSGRFSALGVAETSCTIVYADGTYHREKRTQSTAGSRSEHSFSGRVNADSLAALKTVLDSSELRNAVSDVGEQRAVQEADSTSVWIVRDGGLQHLSFTNEFNTPTNPGRIGGMSNTTYHSNRGKALDPLRHWLKEHTSKHEGDTGEDKTLNDCVPSR